MNDLTSQWNLPKEWQVLPSILISVKFYCNILREK